MAANPFGAHQAGRHRAGREGGRSAAALVDRWFGRQSRPANAEPEQLARVRLLSLASGAFRHALSPSGVSLPELTGIPPAPAATIPPA